MIFQLPIANYMAQYLVRKRSSIGNEAQNALRVVEQAIGSPLKTTRKPIQFPRKKNPAAVALGKMGGMKGGRARAEKLSPEERRSIAQRAAKHVGLERNKVYKIRLCVARAAFSSR
jgi:hypothetical protein